MEFAYVQVNGTREYVKDNLNTTTVVVLQVILRYLDLYIEMGPLMSENQLKESQSRVAPPLLA